MAAGKHVRQEKRVPSFYVMVTAVIFVAFLLIGVWILRAPSESHVTQDTETTPGDVKVRSERKAGRDSQPTVEERPAIYNKKSEDDSEDLQLEKPSVKEKAASDRQSFEDGSGDLQLESDEKDEESSQSKSRSETLQVEFDKEEALPEKVTEKSAMEKTVEAKETVEDKEEEKIENGSADLELAQKDSEIIVESDGAQSELQIENKETAGNWDTQANESKEEKEKVDLKEKLKNDVDLKEKLKDDVDLKETVKDDVDLKETVKDDVDLKETLKDDVDLKEKLKDAEEVLEEPVSDEKIVEKTGEKEEPQEQDGGEGPQIETEVQSQWTLCGFEGASDYIPCLDNKVALKALRSTKHYEHRERHCPDPAPTCLAPLPKGYRVPINWPRSRHEVWYSNVPHPGLVSYKKDQNWVKKSGQRLLFPGGGTQFKYGALHYIDYIEQTLSDIAWGKHARVILDVGCGVASFGGFLFEKEVIAMSFAPKDEHEAQIQLALERGIPAISSVMGTRRLTFPSNVFDVVHCARCRVPWHIEGGKLLLELNRVLRPGGYFVWSATPVYWKGAEDVSIWKAMVALSSAICWELVAKSVDPSTGIGVAIFHKPTTNFCYENRKKNYPPLCDEDDKPDAAWYVPMTACIHKLPSEDDVRSTEWPEEWPLRLRTAPTWLSNVKGLYGKPATADFQSDTEHWQRVVEKTYLRGLGIDWKNIRNVMDMRAVYGGFAAALASQPVWVMNVVQFSTADTLPVIFDRGLFGIYHDWCESFSSYPRTYDLLHSDHLFSKLKKRCNITPTIVEIDRLLRPEGWAIFRDKIDVIKEIRALVESLHWDVRMMYGKGEEGLLAVQKTRWRPEAIL